MNTKFKNTEATEFVVDDFTRGFAQCIDNNWNYAIFARNPELSVYQNEYNAGYVQGMVQTTSAILASRDNSWRNFLIGSTPEDSINIDVRPEYLDACGEALLANYRYTYNWLAGKQTDTKGIAITRLLLRMLGIFDAVTGTPRRQSISFDMLDLDKFAPDQLRLTYDTDSLTFLDLYFVNTQFDLFDAVGDKIGLVMGYGKASSPEAKTATSDHCTAFVKKLPDGEVVWAHNSWCCFWSQSCAVSYFIADDFVTQNSLCQGQIGSNTDFGFNGHGLGFNETTHVDLYSEPRVDGLWLAWRSAAAEQFAETIEEFYEYISIDNTGTYLSGFELVEAHTSRIGLLDMSYRRYVLFVCDGENVTITDSTTKETSFLDYDPHLITPTHIFGCNQPVSFWVEYELQSFNLRPMRRNQLWMGIDKVYDVETAKALVTFTADREPLSIYGRWDLGYGTTEMPRCRPDGSIDAKACSTTIIKNTLAAIAGAQPAKDGAVTSFSMKYGTATVNGKPFIWSESRWADLKGDSDKDFVPDALDGAWNPVKLFRK